MNPWCILTQIRHGGSLSQLLMVDKTLNGPTHYISSGMCQFEKKILLVLAVIALPYFNPWQIVSM